MLPKDSGEIVYRRKPKHLGDLREGVTSFTNKLFRLIDFHAVEIVNQALLFLFLEYFLKVAFRE